MVEAPWSDRRSRRPALSLNRATGAESRTMAQIHETAEDVSRRIRNGRITAGLAIAWWVASIGGIIYVINNPPV